MKIKVIANIIIAFIFCSGTALAVTIHVPGDEPTIQAGIDAAVNGDIVRVADGTYTGPGNKDLNFHGKAITVKSENGPENTIIDCQGNGLGFHFHYGEGQDSVVSGFTIRNGIVAYGVGGINCNNSSPTIRNCIITNNTGSGIMCYLYSSPTIENCTITGNTAEHGGGVHCASDSSPSITNCKIKENNTTGGATIHVSLNSSLTIKNSIIIHNNGEFGGGIGVFESSVNVINCTIADNKGGGIHSYSSSSTITNSLLWGNATDEIVGSGLVVTYSDIQGGYPGEGNIDADPLFQSNNDYYLRVGSPCIDSGTEIGAPEVDIEGNKRPYGWGYDMGAYEYMGSDTHLIPRFRLYNPYTYHHHYTADANEYNVLETLGWIQEGTGCFFYNGYYVIDDVETVRYYRLYNPYSYEHHWTTDANEYNVLGNIGWIREGADGYVFASQVLGSEPMYRLYNPNDGLHHWTMDANERNVLVGYGFIDEGIACYVFH